MIDYCEKRSTKWGNGYKEREAIKNFTKEKFAYWKYEVFPLCVYNWNAIVLYELCSYWNDVVRVYKQNFTNTITHDEKYTHTINKFKFYFNIHYPKRSNNPRVNTP